MTERMLLRTAQKPCKRISLSGVEYVVTEEAESVRLERVDAGGFTVIHVFKDCPDAGERLAEFKRQAAALVLQAVEGEGM